MIWKTLESSQNTDGGDTGKRGHQVWRTRDQRPNLCIHSPREETRVLEKKGLRDTTDGGEIPKLKKNLNLSLKWRANENSSLPDMSWQYFMFCIGSLGGKGMKTDPKRVDNTMAFILSDKCEGLYLLADF